MSRRRSRRSSGTSRISDDEIMDLVTKLQELLPDDILHDSTNAKVSASKVLEETCNCVRKLQGEVEGLSERLSQLLATIESDTPQASIVRSLINQDWP